MDLYIIMQKFYLSRYSYQLIPHARHSFFLSCSSWKEATPVRTTTAHHDKVVQLMITRRLFQGRRIKGTRINCLHRGRGAQYFFVPFLLLPQHFFTCLCLIRQLLCVVCVYRTYQKKQLSLIWLSTPVSGCFVTMGSLVNFSFPVSLSSHSAACHFLKHV